LEIKDELKIIDNKKIEIDELKDLGVFPFLHKERSMIEKNEQVLNYLHEIINDDFINKLKEKIQEKIEDNIEGENIENESEEEIEDFEEDSEDGDEK
jgi:hypothetical protein